MKGKQESALKLYPCSHFGSSSLFGSIDLSRGRQHGGSELRCEAQDGEDQDVQQATAQVMEKPARATAGSGTLPRSKHVPLKRPSARVDKDKKEGE